MFDDRGNLTPLACGTVVLTGAHAAVYGVTAVWVAIVWSPDYRPSLTVFVLALVVLLAAHAAGHMLYAPRVLEQPRARRACAGCDYDLEGIPPEADGCTLCPECGAAWRLT